MIPNRFQNGAQVLLLGAGPAGLALGYELKQRGCDFLIVEKGAAAGESWRRMPANLKLVSPWKSNCLPGTPRDFLPSHGEISRSEYFHYLQSYVQRHRLPVQTGVEVFGVERLPESGFRTRTSHGDFRSQFVVNATGCFSLPFSPDIPGARASSIPQRHVADYHDPGHVRALLGRPSGLILIVGQRLSAGQTMVELMDAGFNVALSHRSPIGFGAGPLAWWFLFRVFPWLEELKLKRHGDRAPANDVKMQGGRPRKLIRSGAVRTFPAIRRFEHEVVHFTDGATLRPDLVIYATGFRPALAHLSSLALEMEAAGDSPKLHELESVSTPGLFFLGLDGARNFQSRFLRGIRNDARFLAERIARKLDDVSCGDSAQGSMAVATSPQSRVEPVNRSGWVGRVAPRAPFGGLARMERRARGDAPYLPGSGQLL